MIFLLLQDIEGLINIFSNIIKTLGIPEYKQNKPLIEKAFHFTLKAILKCQHHPSILAIYRKLKSSPVFIFFHVTLEKILIEVGNLDNSKSSKRQRYFDEWCQGKLGSIYNFYMCKF